MRRSAATPNRGRRSSGAPVALFPFLAVLMCAMGALALLLVTVSRHSRLQASSVTRNVQAAATTADPLQEVQVERENVQWRISQLQVSRQQTEAQLAEARLKLGHLEDHARRLRTQIAQLQASLGDMERLGNDGHRREAAAELARIEGQLVQAEQQLAEARRTAQERQPSYAVMPYEGPHQTRRRPIYLECCATAVILQPEGVAFTVDDFLGPLGPGNPLDVALRATREYLLKARPTTAEVEEPYPLLLVRPDGIEAYYAARTAMLSWGGEFGYELIGQDWKLQFPKASPQLASEVREVVASARVRQQQLVAAAPRHYGPRQSSAKYRVAPFRGGIVPDGDADEGDEPSGYGGYSPRSAFGRSGRSFGTGTGGTETGGTGTGGTGTGGTVAGSASGGTGGTAAGMAQGSAGVAASNAAGSPMAAGSAMAGDSGQASQNAAMPGFVVGRPPREENPLRESPAADRVATVVRPGEWIEKPPPAGKPPDKPKEPPKDRPKVRSLAETRGHNWGLPDAARGSVAVTRSVRVDCYSERLVIVPDAGVAGGQIIPLGDRTAGSIDALISSVWDHMDTWGIAGKGMYWRPVLNFHVAPNGEARFDELKALLDGSGLEVRRHEG